MVWHNKQVCMIKSCFCFLKRLNLYDKSYLVCIPVLLAVLPFPDINNQLHIQFVYTHYIANTEQTSYNRLPVPVLQKIVKIVWLNVTGTHRGSHRHASVEARHCRRRVPGGTHITHTQLCHFNPFNPCEGNKIHFITFTCILFVGHNDTGQ